MESTTSHANVSYYPHIAEIEDSFSSGHMNLASFIDELRDTIVENYDRDVFADYKRAWIASVVEYSKIKVIDLPRVPKPNWENICGAIIDNMVSNSYSFQKEDKSVTRRSASRRSISSGATLTSNDNSSGDVLSAKQVKLTDADKQKIRNMYTGLDKAKMWKLSTGTLVEEQMMKLAISQEYEHLSHSLIMDVRDKCWLSYFSLEEIDEIKCHEAVQLPVLPSNLKSYIGQLVATPRSTLYETMNEVTHAPETDEHWIQDAYNNCFRLVGSGFFPLHDVTEQGIGKRMWSCVDKCFDYSSVRCITGEKCSKASADAANSVRSPSDLSRQQSGRNMDLIFKTKIDDIEIGCGECALVGGVNTTKEFQDACFKMPKVMRDMLVKIVSRSPALVNRLRISGFYIADRLLTLYILDSPVGYVSRYDAFNPVEYPVTENKIRSRMAKLLTMIFSARIIMENCRDAIDDDESDTDLGKFRSAVMEPCFVPVGTNYKKRKN